jgi:hypothetical protein
MPGAVRSSARGPCDITTSSWGAPLRRLASVAVLGAILLLALAPSVVSAASSSVECGQLTGYTAPDPSGPTDGSLQLGQTSPWVVLAAAVLSPAAGTNLPTIVNSGPTCLALDFDDDGAITAIDFAPTGTIEGDVTFDSGSGFYIFADRLIVPTFITDAYPGLAALFVTSYQAGTSLTVTFSVDPESGAFTGFDGVVAFCGTGSVTQGGDGQVGDAIIPASVLDADDIAALEGAGTRRTCATVHSTGVIEANGGNITTTTDVTIAVAPAPGVRVTPPPTDTAATATPTPSSGSGLIAWLSVVLIVATVVLARWSRRAGV